MQEESQPVLFWDYNYFISHQIRILEHEPIRIQFSLLEKMFTVIIVGKLTSIRRSMNMFSTTFARSFSGGGERPGSKRQKVLGPSLPMHQKMPNRCETKDMSLPNEHIHHFSFASTLHCEISTKKNLAKVSAQENRQSAWEEPLVMCGAFCFRVELKLVPLL